MGKRLPNPRLVKIHRNFTIEEIAALLNVHKNTVANWIKQGLPICGMKRPYLITGHDLRAFLEAKKIKHKQPCKPDEIYCVRCREPKKPVTGLIEYRAITDTLGNLVALCPDCESIMNRRISFAKLQQIPAYRHIAQTLTESHITTCFNPTVSCDFNTGNESHAHTPSR